MPEITRKILNKAGLHARPATKLVELTNRYASDIEIHFEGQVVDGKKILEVLTLAAMPGKELRFLATGPDADEALSAISDLVAAKFHTDS